MGISTFLQGLNDFTWVLLPFMFILLISSQINLTFNRANMWALSLKEYFCVWKRFCPKFDLHRKSNLFTYHYPAIKHPLNLEIRHFGQKSSVSAYQALPIFLLMTLTLYEAILVDSPKNSSFGHNPYHAHINILHKNQKLYYLWSLLWNYVTWNIYFGLIYFW